MSKLSKIQSCGIIINSCRFFWGSKTAKMNQSGIYPDVRIPITGFFEERYAPESGCIAFILIGIAHVLSSCAFPKVFFSVVQSVAILMIALLIWFATKNCAMHINPSLFSLLIAGGLPTGTKTASMNRPISEPIPLREPFKILSVHDGILSLRKRDQAVGFIARLSNRMLLYWAFWHGLTSSKVMQLSRILSQINGGFTLTPQ